MIVRTALGMTRTSLGSEPTMSPKVTPSGSSAPTVLYPVSSAICARLAASLGLSSRKGAAALQVWLVP